METKILIALIGSVASVIVAIISLFSNYLNGKKLESLKYEIDKKRSKYQIYDENMKNHFAIIGDFISQIQRCKDYMLIIENSTTDSLDSEVAAEHLNELKNNMFSRFQANSQYFNADNLNAIHSAKNEMLKLNNWFDGLFSQREYVNATDIEKEHIEKSRNLLNNYQNVLRDSRIDILNKIS